MSAKSSAHCVRDFDCVKADDRFFDGLNFCGGACVGGWLLGVLGIAAGGFVAAVITALVGGCVLLFVIRLVKKA